MKAAQRINYNNNMKAAQRINLKEDSLRYKKVGNRYIPDNDPYAYEGLTNGWWLVKVTPNSMTMRATINPNNAEIDTAARDKADELMDIIREAGEGTPVKAELTPEALADWKAFIAKHGEQFNYISYPCLHDVATKIIASLIKS
jgi:hypothetical protein